MKTAALRFAWTSGLLMAGLAGCHHGGHSPSPLHKDSGCPCQSGIDTEHSQRPSFISRSLLKSSSLKNGQQAAIADGLQDEHNADTAVTRWGGEDVGADGFARASGSRFNPEMQDAAGLEREAASRAEPLGNAHQATAVADITPRPAAIRSQGGFDEPAVPVDGVARTRGGQTYFDPAIRAVSFSDAEPRLMVDENGRQLIEPDTSWMTGTDPQRYPDEYLVDGGDRGHPVHYDHFYRKGLDTEDTVGECVDHSGKRKTVASSQVAIYAPRFASVRSVASPSGDIAVAKLAGIHDLRRNSGVQTRVSPNRYAKADQAANVAVRSRVSGLHTRERESGTFNVARLGSHTKLFNLRQDLSYFLRGEMQQASEARLAAGIDAALQWTRAENPVVVAQLDSLHEVTARFRAAEMVGIDDSHKTPGQLKIVKLADRSSAQPGDVITFIIRYDNTGDRELNQVRIIDNLTPRLEFIDDSATSDRPGDIVTEDNEEGSMVLTFQLDEPLPGKKGGVITFQCRVR